MFKDQKKLLDALVAAQLVKKSVADDVQTRAVAASQPAEALLLKERLVTEDQIVAAKSKLLSVPIADLKGREIPKKVLNLMPREVAENYEMVPFEQTGNELHVGLIDQIGRASCRERV